MAVKGNMLGYRSTSQPRRTPADKPMSGWKGISGSVKPLDKPMSPLRRTSTGPVAGGSMSRLGRTSTQPVSRPVSAPLGPQAMKQKIIGSNQAVRKKIMDGNAAVRSRLTGPGGGRVGIPRGEVPSGKPVGGGLRVGIPRGETPTTGWKGISGGIKPGTGVSKRPTRKPRGR